MPFKKSRMAQLIVLLALTILSIVNSQGKVVQMFIPGQCHIAGKMLCPLYCGLVKWTKKGESEAFCIVIEFFTETTTGTSISTTPSGPFKCLACGSTNGDTPDCVDHPEKLGLENKVVCGEGMDHCFARRTEFHKKGSSHVDS